ncbi:MAG: hypothetical protein CMP23_05025 [Rickettsiales bacterium]|nr:hypothetical protein [Rickettsiales bacterium]
MLFAGVLLPILVLAGFAIKGLLEAGQLYEDGLRSQREDGLKMLSERIDRQLQASAANIAEGIAKACTDEEWSAAGQACVDIWRERDPRVVEAVMLNSIANPGATQQQQAQGQAERLLQILARKAPAHTSSTAVALRAMRSESDQALMLDTRLSDGRVIALLDLNRLHQELALTLDSYNRSNPGQSATIEPDPAAQPGVSGAAPEQRISQRSLAGLLPGYQLKLYSAGSIQNPARGLRLWLQVALILSLIAVPAVVLRIGAGRLQQEVRLARMKSDFVSNVSHELRTPLTTIRIMAEMLALDAVPDPSKQGEYHRNIVSEAERLTRLINNVLDFARIEEGRKKFHFGMGNLGDVVFEVVRIVSDYAEKEGFEIKTSVQDDLPATMFDRDAIVQALINLTANAVKYSEDDKRIEVGARSQEHSVVLWVQDHGPGIDAEELPHLFEKFFRGGDSLTREIGGTGLGLAIVHHIVQVHGGEVSAKSTLGAGSTFEIMLPVRQGQPMRTGDGR